MFHEHALCVLFVSPLLQILIYWFVFSVGLGTQEKNGFPYHLWLMCGMMPWLALNSAILGASASIQQAASIIRNVRDRFGTWRPVSSANSVNDLGRLSRMRRSRVWLSSDSTAAMVAIEGNQTVGTSF